MHRFEYKSNYTYPTARGEGVEFAFREHKSENPCADKQTAECADFVNRNYRFGGDQKQYLFTCGGRRRRRRVYTYTVGIKTYFRAPTPRIYRSCAAKRISPWTRSSRPGWSKLILIYRASHKSYNIRPFRSTHILRANWTFRRIARHSVRRRSLRGPRTEPVCFLYFPDVYFSKQHCSIVLIRERWFFFFSRPIYVHALQSTFYNCYFVFHLSSGERYKTGSRFNRIRHSFLVNATFLCV